MNMYLLCLRVQRKDERRSRIISWLCECRSTFPPLVSPGRGFYLVNLEKEVRASDVRMDGARGTEGEQ